VAIGGAGGPIVTALLRFAARAWPGRLTEVSKASSKEINMNIRCTLSALAVSLSVLTLLPGCAVSRGQSSVGEYIDDTTITTQVKAKFVQDKTVSAAAISVETLNGTVMLSGFAKNGDERSMAESLARGVKGVKSVRNELVVRP
jgi:hyperosmotically inducible periplasmic protein